MLLRCRVGAPRVGGGDGQKQVGTDGDFVGEKLAHAHQLRPPRRHGVDLGRGNVAWCLGQIAKNPPKMRYIKFVKLTGYTSACNSLTNFDYKVHVMTEREIKLMC